MKKGGVFTAGIELNYGASRSTLTVSFDTKRDRERGRERERERGERASDTVGDTETVGGVLGLPATDGPATKSYKHQARDESFDNETLTFYIPIRT